MHQLLTPLGKAKTRVKLLLSSCKDEEAQKELKKILDDLNNLEDLLEKIPT